MQPLRIASDVVTDAVFALRSFRRSPGWTFVTLLTVALGIGASTAVFSVADTFLIRPLAYRDASRVYAVSLEGKHPAGPMALPISLDIVREWRTSARTISHSRAVSSGNAGSRSGPSASKRSRKEAPR